jgi:hypothetical protein
MLRSCACVSVTKGCSDPGYATQEEESLANGVARFGAGNWAAILSAYPLVFKVLVRGAHGSAVHFLCAWAAVIIMLAQCFMICNTAVAFSADTGSNKR